jgi:hypothetical protein
MPRLKLEKLGTLLKKLGGKSESEVLRKRALKLSQELGKKGGYYGFEGQGVRWGVYRHKGTSFVGHTTIFRPILNKKAVVEREHIGLEGIMNAMRFTGQKRPIKKFKSYEELRKWVEEK